MTDAVLDEVLAELEIEDPTCKQCGRPMPTRWQWDRADDAERADLLEDGYVSPRGHGCRELAVKMKRSDRISRQEYREQGLAETRRRESVFWARYGEVYRPGMTSPQIAAAMGVGDTTVQKRVTRASRGDL